MNHQTTIKKIILISLSYLLFLIKVNAQFHFDIGVNASLPLGELAETFDVGAGGFIEPKFAINPNLDLGIFIGTIAFGGLEQINGGADIELHATWLFEISPSISYRFSQSRVSPYVGLSTGMYLFRPFTVYGTSFNERDDAHLGFAPRLGVYLGRFNVGAVYNKAGEISFFQVNLGVRVLSRKIVN